MSFGNMVCGGGLDAALNNTGNAYAQGTVGWIGKSTDTSKNLNAVKVTSQTNGFDASGSTSQISIQVRGSATLPTSATDGVILGEIPAFTDANTLTTKTITFAQPSTYPYVWAVINTGVWAAVTNVEYVYSVISSDTDTIVYPVISGYSVIKKSVDEQTPLPQVAAIIAPLTVRFELVAPTVCTLNFQTNFVHRGELFTPSYLGVVGVGVSFEYKYAQTKAGVLAAPLQRFKNASSGMNIYDRNPAHYGSASVVSAELLQAGFYELVCYGTAHTDADSRNGLAGLLIEGGRGLNGLVITLAPNASFL